MLLQYVKFIQIIRTAGLDQYRGWIQNRMSLLPYLKAGKRLIDPALANAVVGFLQTRSFDRSILSAIGPIRSCLEPYRDCGLAV